MQETLERRRSDGSKEIIHPNGTVEEINSEGRTVLYTYPNGDTRKFELGGIEVFDWMEIRNLFVLNVFFNSQYFFRFIIFVHRILPKFDIRLD